MQFNSNIVHQFLDGINMNFSQLSSISIRKFISKRSYSVAVCISLFS